MKKILVIAHDAGGSEIIAAYIKHQAHKYDFHAFVAGPAARVFKRENIPYKKVPTSREKIAPLLEAHSDVKLVLLGTGWMTKIESIALEEAKKLGLNTAVYLESWVNYRQRFGYPERGWKKNLPDEIWTGDINAFQMAKIFFPQTKVRHVPNQYFISIVKKFRSRVPAKVKPGVLFLSDAVTGSEKIFEQLIHGLSQKNTRVVIRFHPADDRARYDHIIEKYKKDVQISKSVNKDIVSDLLAAEVVIGQETVAMVAAVLVGLKTISIVPNGKKLQLPFADIVHIKEVKEVFRLI